MENAFEAGAAGRAPEVQPLAVEHERVHVAGYRGEVKELLVAVDFGGRPDCRLRSWVWAEPSDPVRVKRTSR
jgi:hypothetical protein